MPDAGVSSLLPRVVGLGRAMEMSMLGDGVEAGEALRIGLVNKVVPAEKLSEVTAALAENLAEMPTSALGKIKHALYASFESDLETAWSARLRARPLAATPGTTGRASRRSSRSASRTSPGGSVWPTLGSRVPD